MKVMGLRPQIHTIKTGLLMLIMATLNYYTMIRIRTITTQLQNILMSSKSRHGMITLKEQSLNPIYLQMDVKKVVKMIRCLILTMIWLLYTCYLWTIKQILQKYKNNSKRLPNNFFPTCNLADSFLALMSINDD
eukprot:UN12816